MAAAGRARTFDHLLYSTLPHAPCTFALCTRPPVRAGATLVSFSTCCGSGCPPANVGRATLDHCTVSPGDDDDRPRPASQTVGAAICEHAAGRAAGQRAQTSCLLRGAHDHTITRGPWPAALARQPRPVDAARYLAPSAPPGSPLTSAPLTSSGAFHAAARSPRPDIKNAVAPERLPLHFMQGERVAGIRWDLRLLLRVTWANRRAIPCPAAGPLRRRRVGHRLASRSSKMFL